MLALGEPGPVLDTLARMSGCARDESVVSVAQIAPCLCGVMSAMHDIVPKTGQDTSVTFHESLLAWFDDHERDLPWRRDDVSAWQILISEIMLQQTPVARVIPKWSEWIERWPVPSAMARENVGEVVRAWGKLGYPRRAMRLHECSTVLADHFDDEVPHDVETLLTLPGVGDYTARAVACFAYDAPVPVVDINVRRVIARRSTAVVTRALPLAPTSPTRRHCCPPAWTARRASRRP